MNVAKHSHPTILASGPAPMEHPHKYAECFATKTGYDHIHIAKLQHCAFEFSGATAWPHLMPESIWTTFRSFNGTLYRGPHGPQRPPLLQAWMPC